MHARLTGGIVVVTVGAMLAAAGAAAPSSTGDASRPDAGRRAEHQRVIDHWTAERVAAAVPRHIVRDGGPLGLAHRDGHPGRGNGGGNGGGNGKGNGGGRPGGPKDPAPGTPVDGEVWTGGGLVRDTTGRVLFTLGATNYVCSAGLVEDELASHSLVVTAGHCVYDREHGWATNWVFFPDFQSEPVLSCAPTRCFVADRLVTSGAWALDRSFDHDYAFAALAPNDTGLAEARGAHPIAFDQARGLWVDAFGYPQASPWDGTRLVWCAGETTDDPFPPRTAQGVGCTMTGGGSGGPWFSGFDPVAGTGTVYSVNSYRYSSVPDVMFGPHLGAGAAATYAEANTPGEGNVAVP